jgi:hypothetical protein
VILPDDEVDIWYVQTVAQVRVVAGAVCLPSPFSYDKIFLKKRVLTPGERL